MLGRMGLNAKVEKLLLNTFLGILFGLHPLEPSYRRSSIYPRFFVHLRKLF